MKRNLLNIELATVLATVLFATVFSGCRQGGYVQFGGYAQGGTWAVKANLAGVKTRPEEIQKHIEDILYEIDTTLSGYNKASQLSRFNRGEEVALSPMFEEVLDAAVRFWEETDGALDCAAGPLFDIWGFGFKTDSLPSDELVRRTLAQCGMARLICSEKWPDSGTNNKKSGICSENTPNSGTNTGNLPSAPGKKPGRILQGESGPGIARPKAGAIANLNFNAIAQGYSCDKVADYLYSIGVKDMLVDIGEIFCDGLNPSGRPWRVGVDKPEDGNETPGADLQGIWESSGGPHGIVTSGNYRKFYIKDGIKYSHTIDPRTGYPVQHTLLSATVIAPTAMEADAYATYCMVIGTEKAREFILSRPDLEAYLISEDVWTSPGFNRL